ncbi:hypothetical protein RDI58_022065 [Solanum bulbocastanum]|uniref:Uncharacterized protein n=1 Tax=Solanum bulbocastanum TaxID=147425 RepID=A0AAN8T741_SOLBU
MTSCSDARMMWEQKDCGCNACISTIILYESTSTSVAALNQCLQYFACMKNRKTHNQIRKLTTISGDIIDTVEDIDAETIKLCRKFPVLY